MTELDRERHGLVLKALDVRKSADEVIEMYQPAMDLYDHSVLTEMPFEDVMAFRPLYDFMGATPPLQRSECWEAESALKDLYRLQNSNDRVF